MWIAAFHRIWREFESFPELDYEASLCISFEALCKVYRAGWGARRSSVLQACKHLHMTRMGCDKKKDKNDEKKEPKTFSMTDFEYFHGHDPWPRQDYELDYAHAIRQLEDESPRFAQAIRMKRECYEMAEIGESLGVKERQAHNILQQAQARLAQLMGEAEAA